MSDLKDPRVLFAMERTLLAWNRTSLAFIAFGFLVERAGLLIKAVAPEQTGSEATVMTFWLGLAFIALGIFVSAYSSRQYFFLLKTLNPAEIPPKYGTKAGIYVNSVVAILGALLFGFLYVTGI